MQYKRWNNFDKSRIVANKFCTGVKIVAKQSTNATATATATSNANVSVVDCFATILTPAQNYLTIRCGLLSKFITASPRALIMVAGTLDTAFIAIPGHLGYMRMKHTQTNIQTVHVYSSRAAI